MRLARFACYLAACCGMGFILGWFVSDPWLRTCIILTCVFARMVLCCGESAPFVSLILRTMPLFALPAENRLPRAVRR